MGVKREEEKRIECEKEYREDRPSVKKDGKFEKVSQSPIRNTSPPKFLVEANQRETAPRSDLSSPSAKSGRELPEDTRMGQ